MNDQLEKILYSPYQTTKLTLRNRFVMGPLPTGRVNNRVPMRSNVSFYSQRAKNVGLIIAGAISINHPTATNNDQIPDISTQDEIDVWREVVEAVHERGAKIAGQIWHSGGFRRVGQLKLRSQVTTPSGIFNDIKVGQPMTLSEIDLVINRFAEAAKNVKQAGFDALEIQASHGDLIHDFFSPEMNKRQDKYGLNHRTEFANDVIRSCRQMVGENFPILLRISNFKMYDLSSHLATNLNSYKTFITSLSNSGVDIFDCSALNYYDPAISGTNGSLAYWTKEITGKPVISFGNMASLSPFTTELSKLIKMVVTDPDFLKHRHNSVSPILNDELVLPKLISKEFDLIGIGRPLLLDPEWIAKLGG